MVVHGAVLYLLRRWNDIDVHRSESHGVGDASSYSDERRGSGSRVSELLCYGFNEGQRPPVFQ
ncbi:hypothetical protein Tdes44962_MAKER07899 [Teratosphaeria destructans]|uniref:Uncharacterized protein n=1 Tax=Teratosphaeria destructans TaxID=418781 RepID=A0A9W7SY39_9PEZI|nr:hypothetical protein Tdes44962_MAKER07899 [Teratosphaeria destructans]